MLQDAIKTYQDLLTDDLAAASQAVLEPLQAAPTIIEDDCFIVARSEIGGPPIIATASRRGRCAA